MQFRTEIPISTNNLNINYDSKIMAIGSCFAENMSSKFDYFKFENVVNPFGIIFNAISIERIVKRIVNKELFTKNDIFLNNGLWHCFDVHSELSHHDGEIYLKKINGLLILTHSQMCELSHIIITYGTSWVYRNIETNQIVANCHKLPQQLFTKELLTLNDTQKSIENTISLVRSINTNIKFTFTVSPVRHIKDGFIENNVSKAILLQAVFAISNDEKTTNEVNYFPSYEIILDELRDYRFFKSDMLHPNDIAIDYVWSRFIESSFSNDTKMMMVEVEKIQKMLHHKSLNVESEADLVFKKSIQEKIDIFHKKYDRILF